MKTAVTLLWVAQSRLVTPGTSLAAHVDSHMAFMFDLEAKGTLFASGPFVTDGKPNGSGITIVRAGSADEARAILERDPFVVAGLRTFDLHEWHVLEGTAR